MTESLKTEGEFTYAEAGEGRPLIVLHGLMGALSNFDKTFQHFSTKQNAYLMIDEITLDKHNLFMFYLSKRSTCRPF